MSAVSFTAMSSVWIIWGKHFINKIPGNCIALSLLISIFSINTLGKILSIIFYCWKETNRRSINTVLFNCEALINFRTLLSENEIYFENQMVIKRGYLKDKVKNNNFSRHFAWSGNILIYQPTTIIGNQKKQTWSSKNEQITLSFHVIKLIKGPKICF